MHRIDKDTSGLLVIAKTPEAKTSLGKQFFEKTTQRKYVALVWGRMEEPEGRIEGNIGRNPKDRLQMTVFPDGQSGKTGRYPLQAARTAGLCLSGRVSSRNRPYAPDTRAHEVYRAYPLQRRSLWWRRDTQRHHLCQVPAVCAQLFRGVSPAGTARQGHWVLSTP